MNVRTNHAHVVVEAGEKTPEAIMAHLTAFADPRAFGGPGCGTTIASFGADMEAPDISLKPGGSFRGPIRRSIAKAGTSTALVPRPRTSTSATHKADALTGAPSRAESTSLRVAGARGTGNARRSDFSPQNAAGPGFRRAQESLPSAPIGPSYSSW